MSETIIETTRLTLTIGGKRVIDSLDLALKAGEAVVLAGRNGVGKSTLLRCLAGVYVPDGGAVHRAPGLEPERIGFLSDALSFYSGWTLAQGADFHCRVHRCPGYEFRLTTRIGLSPSARIGSLSAGERVIFQLSLVLAQKPRLLLLDEVLHLADPYIRELALEEIVGAIAAENMALLMVNHTFSDTARIPERLLLMEGGRIVRDVPTEELLRCARKLVLPGEPPPGLPVVFRRRVGDGAGGEYIVYPCDGSTTAPSGAELQEVGLDEIVKGFIGGFYEK